MGCVAIGWPVWVALAGGVAGCLVYEGLAGVWQLWVAVWAIKLLCWEGVAGWTLVGSVLCGWVLLVVVGVGGICIVGLVSDFCWLVAGWRGWWFGVVVAWGDYVVGLGFGV